VAVIVFMEVVMDTLLARIGGADAVKAVVESFYDKVFANTDQAKQRNRQSKFLIQMMDGKAPNAADYMRTAHKKYVHEMNLSDKEFDIVAGHLVASLKEFNVPDDLIEETAGALESMRDPVLDR
jgi:truncated hemoglobin YjbI